MAEPLTVSPAPALLMSGDKITASHLGRDAYVYVRQSTPTQVQVHTESLERQYELRERAVGLGWPAHQVVVIDADLGRSGARTEGRLGFSDLVAHVGLGKVGIVLGIEVSRLARNNADWYQLLDLCALTDTLIADADGVYHPAGFNDRLVLGLKGTMAEAELHLIRSRLTAGLKHKAAKGELRQGLPVGLDYDEDNRVIITPDEAVIEAIATVFRRFDELGSARQVLLSLREDGLLLPRRRNGSSRITWARATYPAVHDFLTNPAYAGAFVFGRTRTEKRVDAAGRVIVRVRLLPREEWAVLIPDHHRGFITWSAYEANTARLRANWRAPRGHGGGAPREGRALLQGLLQCGKCGRTMQTGYSGAKGNSPRYVCARAQQLYGTGPGCQSIGGGRLEKTVLAQLFAILEPASLEATAKALAEADTHHRQRLAAFELAVERARYEAERAHRQFDAVEPENRLVTRTLERKLEDKLAAQRRAEHDLAAQRARRPVTLTEDEATWIRRAGADVAKVFHADTTTINERKQLIRAVIDHIVLTIHAADDDRVADLHIIWQGGASTELSMAMTKRGGHTRTTDENTVQLVRRLAEHYDDKTIAQILSKQRRRTATGLNWTKTRVKTLRISHGIGAFQPPVPETVGADEQDGAMVTIPKAAEILGVSKYTLYRWLRDGFIIGEQLTAAAPWHIRVDQQLRDRIRPEAPEGWLPLDQAAQALGIARQTVLHKVQRGQLQAVHVNQGRRQGLRIQVKPDQTGLFDTP
jgi:DNA invertase Pin-like site-specific DNA recombinase/predicted DNA-binding transcriptional regulator AlpA